MLLALVLNDWVFEKYALEEEDFMKNVGETGMSLFYFSHLKKSRIAFNVQRDGNCHY